MNIQLAYLFDLVGLGWAMIVLSLSTLWLSVAVYRCSLKSLVALL